MNRNEYWRHMVCEALKSIEYASQAPTLKMNKMWLEQARSELYRALEGHERRLVGSIPSEK